MKKNNLTTAVVAGIAGIAGIASVSNAVNLNSDGLGQVLVYPYYTVNNGMDTLISVVNTTDETKAVKIRFLEGKNSRECLDFNIYMSPFDVWVAALTGTDSTIAGHTGQESVQILTGDKTCTVPTNISGREFLPYAFEGALTDGYSADLVRCTEGHFEVIEMGVVIDTVTNGFAASAVDHGNTGDPGTGCGVPDGNWLSGGAWEQVPDDGILPPTGGLFGSASLIDTARGVDVAYNADAIEGYSLQVQHSDPSRLVPDLSTGQENTSNIFYQAGVQSDTWVSSSVQAISALYMHNHIYGEYVLSDSIGANTEWVVTFPTKAFYVDADATNAAFGVVPPVLPFTDAFSATGACEEYFVGDGLDQYGNRTGLWDREEQVPGVQVGENIPSPPPPDIVTPGAFFCWETNVLEFEDTDRTTGVSAILGSNNATHLQTLYAQNPNAYFATGWVSLRFDQSTSDNVAASVYTGLPVTGFAVQRYVNSTDVSGAKNYAGLFAHRYSKSITS